MLWWSVMACSVPEVMERHNPLASVTPVERVPFEGVVEERVDAGAYCYLRLDDGRWVTGLAREVAVGERVEVVPVGFLDTFHSARTGRDFAPLWFGALHPR
ncbi:MAG: hypothetical protein KC656_12050 [Myxococcales bacterium]|nr:hypothetical protein [Myxococcales bacterium]MCA9568572.1 hypothetical protein [Myxococcales bacterium]